MNLFLFTQYIFLINDAKLSVMNRITPLKIIQLNDNEVFVFGSNIAGNHGGGAARTALKWGSIMGKGVGLFGQTYAIPTMFNSVDLIKPYVDDFISSASKLPNCNFLVTPIGCGIAGFKLSEIAPLFAVAINIENIFLPQVFWDYLNKA
jgi:hypothetical protein